MLWAALAYSFRNHRWRSPVAPGAVVECRCMRFHLRGASPHLDTSIDPYADRQELQITAQVTCDGRLQDGGFHEIRHTVDLETEELQTATGETESVHSGIRLSTYSPRSNDTVPEEISDTRSTRSNARCRPSNMATASAF